MFQLQRATWVRAHDGSLHNGQHIVQCALGQTRGQHYVFIENILGDQIPIAYFENEDEAREYLENMMQGI